MYTNTLLQILEAIRAGSSSKREIQAQASLSWGSVSQNITALFDLGVIVPEEDDKTTKRKKGRQTQHFVFSGKDYLLLGIEIKPKTIICSLVNLAGIELCSYVLEGRITEANLFERVNMAHDEIVKKAKIKSKNISAVSFSLTGAVDARQMIWLATPKIPSINNFAFSKVSGIFPEAGYIRIEHDITALAKTVIKQSSIDSGNYVFIFISDGIGMTVYQDGKFLSGSRGLAGEVGHIPYECGLPGKCACGNENCLELFLSTGGILNKIKTFKGFDSAASFDEAVTKLNFVQKNKILEYIIPLLNRLAITACNIFDPETLIISGDAIAPWIDLLELGFEKQLKQRTWRSSPGKVLLYKMNSFSSAYGTTLGLETKVFPSIADHLAEKS